jgi:hypothetical protein
MDDYNYTIIDCIEIPIEETSLAIDVSLHLQCDDLEKDLILTFSLTANEKEMLADLNMYLADLLAPYAHACQITIHRELNQFVISLAITKYAEHPDDYLIDVKDIQYR